MVQDLSTEATLEKTVEHENKFEWLEAAKIYEQALPSKSRSSSDAEIWEKLGFCYNLASRQSEDPSEFKKLRQLAAEAYKEAARLLETEDDPISQGKSALYNAVAAHSFSWIASTSSEKEKMLDECRKLCSEALKAFKSDGDELNYGKTCITLLLSLFDRAYLASTEKEKQIIAQEGVYYGNEAISALSKLDNHGELLKAYSLSSLLNWYLSCITEQEGRRRELADTSLRYVERAVALSKETDNPYCTAMSSWVAAFCTMFFTGRIQSSLEYAKKMLKTASTVRDNYLKGIANYLIALITDWMVSREGNPNKKKRGYEDIIKHSGDAIYHLAPLSRDRLIAEIYYLYAQSHSYLADESPIDSSEKLTLSKKAIEIGRKGLEYAVRSGSPEAMGSVLHALSKALHFSSNLEPRKDIKIKLLEEALSHRGEYNKIVDAVFPSNNWVLGIGKTYAAQIGAELSSLETGTDEKKILLENAISNMEAGVSHARNWISSRAPVLPQISTVAGFEDTFGEMLNDLYTLTREREALTRAIEVYNEAAKKFVKVDLPSRVAESYWKMARNKEQLGDLQVAAEDFEEASRHYKAAAQKIPQFADFYDDYHVYMKAWSEIERAKLAHKREEYTKAKQNYEKTANLLAKSNLWNYLSPNFQAWSFLEEAEDLSRQEKSKESIDVFNKAAFLYEKSRNTIEDALAWKERTEVKDEKEMIFELVRASETRREYCLGRVAVEEARILDRQGDHLASSRKYDSAAQGFQKVSDSIEREEDRQELTPIICLCRAWQAMTRAEAENSPDLFLEASKLFEVAREASFNEKAKTLALGHSRFCLALEAGTRFEDTRDATHRLTATRHLESAANYYLKAGFMTASEYAYATLRLFDGYVYMDNAHTETDPEKKAKFYVVAERVLQNSADSFQAANHPEKARQVHRLLEKVREERTLATSLNEVLHAPTITSSTASFVTPSPTYERAVGLERFDHTYIQGRLTVPEEVDMEEDLEIKLDLVNVAKNFGLLVRVDNLIPEEFRVTEKPSEYDVKKGSIELGGKRFEPLQVESIKISARPSDFGLYEVRPQVVYIDDAGQFRTCTPEAVHIKVRAPPRAFFEEKARKKYEIVYVDLLRESQRVPKSECRVAIAQIGLSKAGDIVNELYEETTPGLFGIREDRIEEIRSTVKNMIENAHANDVNILLFPELTIDLNYAPLKDDLINLAKTYEMYIIPGSYHDQKTRRNVSTVIGPEGLLWQQEKHIPAMIFYQGKRLKEGIDVGALPRKTLVCNTEFGRIAICICRDFLDMDLRVELKNFEPPIDLVFNPAFTPVTVDFKAVHFDARRSIYAYCFFANVAEFGDSLISTPEKERVERTIPSKEESLIYKDIDLFNLRSEREKWEKIKRRERGFIQSTR